jgi:hypothetical protein
MKKLKLGIIGMSEGNGHPYSWSAIFNGFNQEHMNNCPFPVIPEYLAKEKFPENFLGHLAEVTHVWTQDPEISKHIAKASNIPFIVERMEDMIGQVDAILLARDDAENHKVMAEPFIKASLPIFIDKPFTLSLLDAEEMLSWQKYESQIFTCSSLRYANELMLTNEDFEILGDIYTVEASVMKYWETYAIHLLEPLVAQLPNRGPLVSVHKMEKNKLVQALIEWQNFTAYVKVTSLTPSPLTFNFVGSKASISKCFLDSFACFKFSLSAFIEQVMTKKLSISREETLELVKILSWKE